MSTLFISSKGGNGTTVTASSFALLSAQRGTPTILIDLCGDVPAAIGLAEPSGPGINDWLSETNSQPFATFLAEFTPADDNLIVLHRGSSYVEGEPRWAEFADVLRSTSHNVVIDAGTTFVPDQVRLAMACTTLVTKSCYLSLRRATNMARPTNVIVVKEEARALTSKDISHVLGVPVVAEIPYQAAISRSVDAGLLASRCQQHFGEYLTSSL